MNKNHWSNLSETISRLPQIPERITLTPRPYQAELIENAKFGNYIIYLPTGLGKTLIATELIKWKVTKEDGSLYSPRRQALMLVDRVCLVSQHGQAVAKQTGLNVGVFCGSYSEQRDYDLSQAQVEVWMNKAVSLLGDYDIVIATAGWFLNMLESKKCIFSQYSMVVFDEAHHCRKLHPYNKIMQNYYWTLAENIRPHIIGLTASPGGELTLVDTCLSLHCFSSNMNCGLLVPRTNESRNNIASYLVDPELIYLYAKQIPMVDLFLDLCKTIMKILANHLISSYDCNIILAILEQDSLININELSATLLSLKSVENLVNDKSDLSYNSVLLTELQYLSELYQDSLDINSELSSVRSLTEFFIRIHKRALVNDQYKSLRGSLFCPEITNFIEKCSNDAIKLMEEAKLSESPKAVVLKSYLAEYAQLRREFLAFSSDKFNRTKLDKIIVFVQTRKAAYYVTKYIESISTLYRPCMLIGQKNVALPLDTFSDLESPPELKNIIESLNASFDQNKSKFDFLDASKNLNCNEVIPEISEPPKDVQVALYSIDEQPERTSLQSLLPTDQWPSDKRFINVENMENFQEKTFSKKSNLSMTSQPNNSSHRETPNCLTPLSLTSASNFESSRICEIIFSSDVLDSTVPNGMTVVQQNKVLEEFRNGRYNVLVATSVAEEGLDVPSCNVVIRFDIMSSVETMIQSRGRARENQSKFVCIITPDSKEPYLLDQLRLKEQNMTISIDGLVSGAITFSNILNDNSALSNENLESFSKTWLNNWLMKQISEKVSEDDLISYDTRVIDGTQHLPYYESHLTLNWKPSSISKSFFRGDIKTTRRNAEKSAAASAIRYYFSKGLIFREDLTLFLEVHGVTEFEASHQISKVSLLPAVKDVVASDVKGSNVAINYIGKLNEWIQKRSGYSITYTLLESGPKHKPSFISKCELFISSSKRSQIDTSLRDGVYFHGNGLNKQEARLDAAKQMLSHCISANFNPDNVKCLIEPDVAENVQALIKHNPLACGNPSSSSASILDVPVASFNPVSYLFEYTQKNKNSSIQFNFLPISGPAHMPVIQCQCVFMINNGVTHTETGAGKNKSAAKIDAATKLLSIIEPQAFNVVKLLN